MMHDYVALKIRDLENERLDRTLIAEKMQEAGDGARPKTKPVIGGALRAAGRTLRRVGEGIEDWAAPASGDCDGKLFARRGPG